MFFRKKKKVEPTVKLKPLYEVVNETVFIELKKVKGTVFLKSGTEIDFILKSKVNFHNEEYSLITGKWANCYDYLFKKYIIVAAYEHINYPKFEPGCSSQFEIENLDGETFNIPSQEVEYIKYSTPEIMEVKQVEVEKLKKIEE